MWVRKPVHASFLAKQKNKTKKTPSSVGEVNWPNYLKSETHLAPPPRMPIYGV